MGLPLWSSIGYGNDDRAASQSSKPEASSAPRRSPIQRRSPTRPAHIRDPETGQVRSLRRSDLAPVTRRPPPVPRPYLGDNPPLRRLHRPGVRSPLIPSELTGLQSDALTQLSITRDIVSHAVEATEQLERVATSRPLLDPARQQTWLEGALRDSARFRSVLQTQMLHLHNLSRMFRHGTPADSRRAQEIRNISDYATSALDDIKRQFDLLEQIGLSGQTSGTPTASGEGSARTLSALAAAIIDNSSPPLPDHARADGVLRELANHNLTESGGLGDRTRSVTPENDPDAWNLMLTTLEPDERLPSEDSSFTSAAASASFSVTESSRSNSASASANSSRTDLTVPQVEDNCDSDDNQDDERTPRTMFTGTVGHPFPDVIPSPSPPLGYSRTSPDPPMSPATDYWEAPTRYGARPRTLQRTHNASFDYPFVPRSLSPLSYTTTSSETGGREPLESLGLRAGPAAERRAGPLLAPPRQRPSERQSQRIPPYDLWRTAMRNAPPTGSVTIAQEPREPPSQRSQHDVTSEVQRTRALMRHVLSLAVRNGDSSDPDFEMLRESLRQAANDAHLSDDYWAATGLASFLMGDNITQDEAGAGAERERP